MIFNNNYYSPMDREYDISIPTNEMPHFPETEEVEPVAPDLSVKDIGMSVPMGIAAANPAGIQAKIRAGAGALEIGFPGAFHGNRNAHTPEMYGKDAREAIKEIGKASDVKFTTHAAYNLMGLTGVDQQGNFSWEFQKLATDEVKKAIDFAADTTNGGSIVVHTGEFDRPLSEQPWSRDQNGRLLFKKTLYEPEDAVFKVIDDRTGQIMSTVQKDRLVARSKWNTAESDYDGIDFEGNPTKIKKGDYIDYEDRKITDPFDPRHGRVPKYNKQTGRFDVEMWHFDDFVKEAEERNRLKEQKFGRKLSPEETILPEEVYLQATLETQEGHSRGWALQYAEGFERAKEQLDKLKEMRKYYEEIDNKLPEDEKWKIFKQDDTLYRMTGGMIPPESKSPLDIIDQNIKDIRKRMEFEHQASMSQEQQAADTAETRFHIKSQIKRSWAAGLRSYAEAGIHAMDRSKGTKEPLFIAMENIFPDRYGGHPEELKELITGARQRMVDFLTKKTMTEQVWDREKKQYKNVETENPYHRDVSKREAERLAEQHIKATLDTGHLNLWRKFWQHDPSKTREQNDKEFDKWYTGQVEDLAKRGMIGNVHLTDNFGYSDDHTAVGHGNAPVKDVVKILKKHGYDHALTTEPGADASTDQGDFWGLMKAWRHFGSPIYGASGPVRVGAPGGDSWTNVQGGYFGQTYRPYFIFPPYAPSNDWTLWTGVPLE